MSENNRFSKFDDPALLGKMQSLINAGREDDARKLTYRILAEDPDLTVEWVIAEKKPVEELEAILGWFLEIEKFEYCAVLKRIIDRVKDK